MRSVIQVLYRIAIEDNNVALSEKLSKRELSLYDRLKSTLSEESDTLLEEFIETKISNYDVLSQEIFKRGLTMGIKLAAEAFREGEEI